MVIQLSPSSVFKREALHALEMADIPRHKGQIVSRGGRCEQRIEVPAGSSSSPQVAAHRSPALGDLPGLFAEQVDSAR